MTSSCFVVHCPAPFRTPIVLGLHWAVSCMDTAREVSRASAAET